MLIQILLVLLFVALFAFFRKDQPPVYGIYTQPGKWYPLKFIAFYLMLRLRRWRASKSKNAAGYGVKLNLNPAQMEGVQPLTSEHPKAVDAVFFMAAKDGYYFVLGNERRFGNKAHCSMYLLIPQVGLLTLCQQPETLFTDSGDDYFGAGGICIKPVEPMKKWRIEYNGKAKLLKSSSSSHQTEEVLDVSLNADWVSDLPYFDFDSDMDPAATARAFARETWTREYFENLRKGHQSHYEQMGNFRGTVAINGKMYELNMPSFRDHSYSPIRDWKLMHRYAYFTIFLTNGMKAVVGIICQPSTCSRIEMGYVYTPVGELHPLSWCDFRLEHHGEGGTPPVNHAFQFGAGDIVYTVSVTQKEIAYHYMGEDWDARNFERFCEYTVNDIPGYGVSEWNYRNYLGRSVTSV